MTTFRFGLALLHLTITASWGLTPCELSHFSFGKSGSMVTVEGRLVGGHKGAYLVPSDNVPILDSECVVFLIPVGLNEFFGLPKPSFVHSHEELDRIFRMYRLGDPLYTSNSGKPLRRNLFEVEGIVFVKRDFEKFKKGFGPKGRSRVALEIKSIKVKAGPDYSPYSVRRRFLGTAGRRGS